MQMPPVHLVIVQPTGYVHSLAFVDHARYFSHQFRRLGATVTMAKNRLRSDAVNFVFGAHLGFSLDFTRRHACVFVNLEQLGEGGAQVNPDYLQLLRKSAVVDYDADNVRAYAQDPADVPLISFLHAPYLAEPNPPLESRPIDLLFFGSINDRRREFIARVEASGATVASFDHPLYGPERDQFIRQAKAVLNCHFYGASRFEQARVFQCLSLGTPVISERTPRTRPPAGFEDAVFWLDGQSDIEPFFRERFNTPGFFEQARTKLGAFRQHDPIEAYADLLAFAMSYTQAHRSLHPRATWKPRALTLVRCGQYEPGVLNVSAHEREQPDLLLDFSQALDVPLQRKLPGGEDVQLDAASLARVHAADGVDGFRDLDSVMTNALTLLEEGGELVLDLPHEQAVDTARWSRYTAQFWLSGWFSHRFEMSTSDRLDAGHHPGANAHAGMTRVVLRKTATSLRERTVARTFLASFGDLPDDANAEDAQFGALVAAPSAASTTQTRPIRDVFASLLN